MVDNKKHEFMFEGKDTYLRLNNVNDIAINMFKDDIEITLGYTGSDRIYVPLKLIKEFIKKVEKENKIMTIEHVIEHFEESFQLLRTQIEDLNNKKAKIWHIISLLNMLPKDMSFESITTINDNIHKKFTMSNVAKVMSVEEMNDIKDKIDKFINITYNKTLQESADPDPL